VSVHTEVPIPTKEQLESFSKSLKNIFELTVEDIKDGSEQTAAFLKSNLNYNHFGLSFNIGIGPVSIIKEGDIDQKNTALYSVLLSRIKEAECKLVLRSQKAQFLNKSMATSISRWFLKQDDIEHEYAVIRLQAEISVKDLGDILAALKVSEAALLSKIENSRVRNPEIIIDIKRNEPIFFAQFDAELEKTNTALPGAKQHAEVYAFPFKPLIEIAMDPTRYTFEEAKKENEFGFRLTSAGGSELTANKDFGLMVDFGPVPVRPKELVDMIEKESGTTGFSNVTRFAQMGEGQVHNALLVLSTHDFTETPLTVEDLNPVLQRPFIRLYDNKKGQPLDFYRGLNALATIYPKDFPSLKEKFDKLQISMGEDFMLLLKGSLGMVTSGFPKSDEDSGAEKYSQGKKSDDDEQNKKTKAKLGSLGKHFQIGLYAELDNWELPETYQAMGLSPVVGADFKFFLEAIPGVMQYGVASTFKVDADSVLFKGVDVETSRGAGNVSAGSASRDMYIEGKYEVVIHKDSIGYGFAGLMNGVWHSPGNLPIALTDPAIKIVESITADAAIDYMAGVVGGTMLNVNGEKREVMLGGDFVLNVEIKPPVVFVTLKAAGMKGSVDSLRVSDVVDLANIALNIKKGQWKPWEIPDNPLKMDDLYNAQIKEPAFYFVSPGASDPDLKMPEGLGVRGILSYGDLDIGYVFVEITQTPAWSVDIETGLTNCTFNDINFGGLDFIFKVQSDDITSSKFVAKSSVAIADEEIGIDFQLASDRVVAIVTLPKSLIRIFKETPIKLQAALDQVSSQLHAFGAFADATIKNSTFNFEEAWSVGLPGYEIYNGKLEITKGAEKLNVSIHGDMDFAGSRLGFSGDYKVFAGEGEVFNLAMNEASKSKAICGYALANTKLSLSAVLEDNKPLKSYFSFDAIWDIGLFGKANLHGSFHLNPDKSFKKYLIGPSRLDIPNTLKNDLISGKIRFIADDGSIPIVKNQLVDLSVDVKKKLHEIRNATSFIHMAGLKLPVEGTIEYDGEKLNIDFFLEKDTTLILLDNFPIHVKSSSKIHDDRIDLDVSVTIDHTDVLFKGNATDKHLELTPATGQPIAAKMGKYLLNNALWKITKDKGKFAEIGYDAKLKLWGQDIFDVVASVRKDGTTHYKLSLIDNEEVKKTLFTKTRNSPIDVQNFLDYVYNNEDIEIEDSTVVLDKGLNYGGKGYEITDVSIKLLSDLIIEGNLNFADQNINVVGTFNDNGKNYIRFSPKDSQGTLYLAKNPLTYSYFNLSINPISTVQKNRVGLYIGGKMTWGSEVVPILGQVAVIV
jgi:hypothetical protein